MIFLYIIRNKQFYLLIFVQFILNDCELTFQKDFQTVERFFFRPKLPLTVTPLKRSGARIVS